MPIRFPDLPAILAAMALAPVLLLPPGYFWSRLLDLGPVTRQERASWSLLLSLATSPILAYNFFLIVPYKAFTVWLFALLQTALPTVLCFWFRAPPQRTRLRSRHLWIFPALMALMAVSCVIDVEVGQHLYRGQPSGDYVKHIVVTDAIHRTGIHPINPTFYPGRPLALFYYFFWFLLCSMLDGLSFWRLGPRMAVEAMTAWAVVGLFALIFVLATRFLRPLTRRTIPICFSLVFAAGLDLLPVIFWGFVNVQPGRLVWRKQFYFYPALDTWNWVGQVASWLETAAWVPHHLAAVVVSMTAFLLVFGLSRPGWVRIFLVSCAVASALGMSVWVTLVFVAFWLVWTSVAAYRKWWEELKAPLAAAVPATLLALPFLYNLARARLENRPPLVFDVRDFGFLRTYTLFSKLGAWKELLDLAALLPAYFLELGIFFLGGLFWWKYRRRPLEPPQLALAVLLGVSVIMTSFLRSAIDNNDFGWRGFLPAHVVLLLWTAWMLERLWRLGRRPPLVIGCLLSGFLVVVSDWVVMSAFPIVQDLYASDGSLGRRNWAMKRFYEKLQPMLPESAILQHNPDPHLQYHHSFYANRQTALLDQTNGPLFAARGKSFKAVLGDIESLFAREASAEHIADMARKYKIDVLIVKDTDANWGSRAFEDVRRFRLLEQCEFARAYEVIGTPLLTRTFAAEPRP